MKKEKKITTGTINLHIEKLNNAYSKFSDVENQMLILDNELVSHIEESAKEQPRADVLNININVNGNPTEEEINEFSKTLKNHYSHEILENKKNIKRLNIISLTLLLIGCIFIGFLHFLYHIETPYIILTILEICAWVFVWEFVDTFCFKKMGYKIKNKFYEKLKQSKIVIY